MSETQPLTKSYWPKDSTKPLLEMTVGQALQKAAAQAPDHEALVEAAPAGQPSLTGARRTDRRWTYAELLNDATHCAHWLLQRFEPGQHLCVWAPNVPEWTILQFGAALAGMVLVTANPALRKDELEYVLKQSRCVGLFHVDRFRSTDMAAIAASLNTTAEIVSFTNWLEPLRKTQSSTPLPEVDPYSAAQIQYTSGTTGEPKGALLHHMGLVTNAFYVQARAHHGPGVLINPMPLFHASGSAIITLGSVVTQSTMVLVALFEPDLILTTTQEERGTLLAGVPTMQLALMEQRSKKTYDISSLQVIVSGGAPVSVALSQRVETVLGVKLTTVYGQTELSPVVCQTSPTDSSEDKAETAGQPLWNAEVRIADPANGKILPLGAEGEIQTRGYQVMLGYYDKPQATRDTITQAGWLRSGDLGTMDARGYLKVTGRLKDMIIRGGENIYPVEIEAVLAQHEAVADVAVFGVPDPTWGEIVAAAIRFAPDA
ncbi:MAG: AMP-binding protein, partial [Sinobacteraceae bacterium]|nr:AMP-binding protein [Nevskiaceae bacterium]